MKVSRSLGHRDACDVFNLKSEAWLLVTHSSTGHAHSDSPVTADFKLDKYVQGGSGRLSARDAFKDFKGLCSALGNFESQVSAQVRTHFNPSISLPSIHPDLPMMVFFLGSFSRLHHLDAVSKSLTAMSPAAVPGALVGTLLA